MQELMDQNVALRAKRAALHAELHAAHAAGVLPPMPINAPLEPAADPVQQPTSVAIGQDTLGEEEAVMQARKWWVVLQEVCHDVQAQHVSMRSAVGVVGDLKALLEVYPGILHGILAGGHTAALCNHLHCPPHLRCAAPL